MNFGAMEAWMAVCVGLTSVLVTAAAPVVAAIHWSGRTRRLAGASSLILGVAVAWAGLSGLPLDGSARADSPPAALPPLEEFESAPRVATEQPRADTPAGATVEVEVEGADAAAGARELRRVAELEQADSVAQPSASSGSGSGSEDWQDEPADSSASSRSSETPASSAALPASDGTPPRVVQLPDDFGPPGGRAVIPPRPEWVGRQPGMVGDVYELPVSSSLESNLAASEQALRRRIVEATQQYVREYLGDERATMFIHLDPRDIEARLVDSQSTFSDVVETSVAPMHQSHALLRIPASFRAELDMRWNQVVATSRAVGTGAAMLGGVVLLSLLFGYYRLDTATRGYYTRRLQWGLAAGILLLVAIGFLYFRQSAQWLVHLL